MQGYCVACHTKTEMKNPKTVKTENGKPIKQGVCRECGTKTYKIVEARN